MPASGGALVTERGKRSVAAGNITGSVMVTGDNADVTR
jgi:hypothetical protein